MSRGREIADAYIDVHGDLSKFRKDLEQEGMKAARKEGEEAGEEYGQAFADGFEKRGERAFKKKWDAVLDSFYSDSQVDWDKAIGAFDAGTLDEAKIAMSETFDQWHEKGLIAENDWVKLNERMEEALGRTKDLRAAEADRVAETQRMKDALAAAQREAKLFEQTLEGLVKAGHTKALEDDFKNIADAMRTMDWSTISKGHRDMASLRDRTIEVADAMREQGRVSDAEYGKITGHLDRMTHRHKAYNLQFDRSTVKAGALSRAVTAISGRVKLSWARMDSTVRTVLGLIMASASDIAVLGSGAASSLTAIVSSAGMAATALVPLGGAALAFGTAIGLAVASMDTMKKDIPGLQAAFDEVGDAWQDQAREFGKAWGGALKGLMTTLSTSLNNSDIGAGLGKAFAGITGAFDSALKGPGFQTFLHQMGPGGPMANAVEGLGKGLAGMFEWLMNMMAAAAPVAEELGALFGAWGAKLAEGSSSIESWNTMVGVFQKGKESLLAILDVVGSLGSALGTLFMAGADTGNQMLRDLAALTDQFNAWMTSAEGQQTLNQWFRDGKDILYSLKPVLVGLAEAMDILVTPQAIANFTSLMEKVGQILPHLAGLLKVVSDLQILNIVASSVLLVAEAFKPLLPILQPLAESIGTTLVGAMEALTPLFSGIGAILAPFIQGIKDLWDQISPKLIPAFAELGRAGKAIGDVLGPVVSVIMSGLVPVLSFLVGGILDSVIGLFRGIANVFEGVKKVFEGNWGEGIKQIFSGLIEAVWSFVTLFAAGKIVSLIGGGLKALGPLFKAGLDAVKGLWDNLIAWFAGIGKFLWDGLIKGLQAGWTAVTTFFSTIITNIITFVKGLFGIHSPSTVFAEIGTFLMQGLIQGVESMVAAVSAFFTTVFEGIVTVVKTVWEGVSTFFSTLWTGIVTIFTTAWDLIVAGVTLYINTVSTIITTVLGLITGGWSAAWEGISTFLSDTWDNIVDAVSTAITAVQTWISDTMSAIKTAWDTVYTALHDKVKTIFDNIKTKIETVIGAVKTWLSSTMSTIKSNLATAWDNILSKVKTIFDNVKTKITSVFNSIKDWLSDKVSAIKTTLSDAWDKVLSKVKTAFDNVKTAIETRFGDAVEWIGGIPGKITGALGDLGSLLTGAGRAIIDGLLAGLQAAWGGVTSFVGGIADWIAANKGPLPYDAKLLIPAGKAIMGGLLGGLESKVPALLDTLRDVTDTIGSGLDGAGNPVSDAAAALAAAAAEQFAPDRFYDVGAAAGAALAEGFESTAGLSRLAGLAMDGNRPVVIGAGGGFDTAPGWTSNQPVIDRSVHVEAGAVVVQTPTENPELVANKVLDKLVAVIV